MDAIAASDTAAAKRKRSPSSSSAPPSAPAAKVSKTTSSGQLSINYLARQSSETLPLLNKDDALPSLLSLLSAYNGVLDRQESLASNLGARPLGPILIKRFERCFDAPPNVVTSHHKASTAGLDDVSSQITWLEVIEFARSHPSQFTLSAFSEGRRVCQFYYPQKQLRVQITEEDFLFINSGRCQELIPPLPIWEDEEKEVGACDVLEGRLKELTTAADIVAARTRQLSHRLKGRRAAILERRADGGSGSPAKASAPQTTTAPPSSSGPGSYPGFVAVNNVLPVKVNGDNESNPGSFAAVRSELLRHFESLPQNQNPAVGHSKHGATGNYPDGPLSAKYGDGTIPDPVSAGGRPESVTPSLSPGPNMTSNEVLSCYTSDTAPGRQSTSNQTTASGHRPSSSGGGNNYGPGQTPIKHNFSRPLPPALESSQPYRPLCQAHMDGLPRGHRVLPPCDRCRRLRMDCVKNLTSCAGCTKKHARCHWRDVSRDELGALDHLMDAAYPETAGDLAGHANGYANGPEHGQYESDDDDSNPLEDLEALGEKEERENEARELAQVMKILDEEDSRTGEDLSEGGWEELGGFAKSVDVTTEGVDAQDVQDGGGSGSGGGEDASADKDDGVAHTAEPNGNADVEVASIKASDDALQNGSTPAPVTEEKESSEKPPEPRRDSPSWVPFSEEKVQSTLTGFRAVNDSVVGGADSNGSTWP